MSDQSNPTTSPGEYGVLYVCVCFLLEHTELQQAGACSNQMSSVAGSSRLYSNLLAPGHCSPPSHSSGKFWTELELFGKQRRPSTPLCGPRCVSPGRRPSVRIREVGNTEMCRTMSFSKHYLTIYDTGFLLYCMHCGNDSAPSYGMMAPITTRSKKKSRLSSHPQVTTAPSP